MGEIAQIAGISPNPPTHLQTGKQAQRRIDIQSESLLAEPRTAAAMPSHPEVPAAHDARLSAVDQEALAEAIPMVHCQDTPFDIGLDPHQLREREITAAGAKRRRRLAQGIRRSRRRRLSGTVLSVLDAKHLDDTCKIQITKDGKQERGSIARSWSTPLPKGGGHATAAR